MNRSKKTIAEIEEFVADHPRWSRCADNGTDTLVGEFTCNGFAGALGFMASVGVIAAELDHHPELTNVYNKVSLRWTTHDSAGVTDFDFAAILRVEQVLESTEEQQGVR